MTATLLGLPVELRALILQWLFRSVTVRHGFSRTERQYSRNTSVLRMCRQIYREARPIMLSNILLYFSSTEAMLDCLIALSADCRHKLRYVRFKAFPLPLYTDDFFSYTTYNTSEALSMLPGLQLDRLVAEDCYHDEDKMNDPWGHYGTYSNIETLIASDGWKELHFVSPTTEFMTHEQIPHGARVKQPAGWSEFLLSRDGESSRAEVKMYVANEPEIMGMADDPDNRAEYEVIPGHLIDESQDTAPHAAAEATEENHDYLREVLVIAMRGNGVSFVQDGSALNEDIKSLLDKMGWEDIKSSGRHVSPEDCPCAHL